MDVLIDRIKQQLVRVINLPYKLFLALFLLAAAVGVLALRTNNQQMIDLREELYQADRSGGDVNAALNELREYVYGHMNTDLSSGAGAIRPPIQLKHTYQRLQEAESVRVKAINDRVYTEGQAYCERLNPESFSGRSRVPCVQAYVERNGAKPNPVPPALYQFDFVSPSWSPDLAGWSLVATAVFFICFLVTFVKEKWSKTKLRPWRA